MSIYLIGTLSLLVSLFSFWFYSENVSADDNSQNVQVTAQSVDTIPEYDKLNDELQDNINNQTFAVKNSDGTYTDTVYVTDTTSGSQILVGRFRVTGSLGKTYDIKQYLSQSFSKNRQLDDGQSATGVITDSPRMQTVLTHVPLTYSLTMNFVSNGKILKTAVIPASSTIFYGTDAKNSQQYMFTIFSRVLPQNLIDDLPSGYTFENFDAFKDLYMNESNQTVNIPVRPLNNNEHVVTISLVPNYDPYPTTLLTPTVVQNLTDGQSVDLKNILGSEATLVGDPVYHASMGNSMIIQYAINSDRYFSINYTDQDGQPILLKNGTYKQADQFFSLKEFYKLQADHASGKTVNADDVKTIQEQITKANQSLQDKVRDKELENNPLKEVSLSLLNLLQYTSSTSTSLFPGLVTLSNSKVYFVNHTHYSLVSENANSIPYTAFNSASFFPDSLTDQQITFQFSLPDQMFPFVHQLNLIYNVPDINATFNYVDQTGKNVGQYMATGRPEIIDPTEFVPKGYQVINDQKETVVKSNPGPFTIKVKADSNNNTNGGGSSSGGTTTPNSATSSSATAPSSSSTSSSSSSKSKSSSITYAVHPVAKQGAAVYGLKHLYLYKYPNFKKSQRIASYVKKPRINRPMFVVTDYARSKSGLLRYKVQDVNHHSQTNGKVGFITASWKIVRPVYYQGTHKRLTVINPNGVNEYRQRNLTGKIRNFKQGTRIIVVGLIKYRLTTRYKLANGHYITGNRKLVLAGNFKQPKQLRVKRATYFYNSVNLTKRRQKIKTGTVLNIKKWAYSQPYSLKHFGTKRYQTAGGWISGSKQVIQIINKH